MENFPPGTGAHAFAAPPEPPLPPKDPPAPPNPPKPDVQPLGPGELMLNLVAVIAPWSFAGPMAVTHWFVATADEVAETILENVVLDVTFTIFVTVLVFSLGRTEPAFDVVVEPLLDDLEAFGGMISVPFTFSFAPDTESS
jgi:hypothetical protein